MGYTLAREALGPVGFDAGWAGLDAAIYRRFCKYLIGMAPTMAWACIRVFVIRDA